MKPETSLSQVMNGGEDDAADSEMEVQESLPGEQENNVHLIVGLGMHITEHAHGCNAFRFIEGGLAAKSELQHGDQIQKINGRDLKDLKVEQIADIFEDLDTTKTITLRVVRQHAKDDGCHPQNEADIIIITIPGDSIISGFDEIDSSFLRYQSSTLNKIFAHTRNDGTPVYVNVNGDSAQVSTTLNEKCKFIMMIYQGAINSPRVYVIQNVSTGQVFEKTNSSDEPVSTLRLRTVALRDRIGKPGDGTCFYECSGVFQSVTDTNSYLAVAGTEDDAALVIVTLDNGTDPTCMFNIIDWDSPE